MSVSRPTRDRLIAAISVVLILAVVFGVVLLAKSCDKHTVTYYDDDKQTVLRTEYVVNGETANNWRPDDSERLRTFDCWVTSDGLEYDFSNEVTDEVKLYAKWE